MEIRYWNRRKAREESEKVYGDKLVELLYGNPTGFAFTDTLLAGKGLSKLYGAYQSSRWSRHKIDAFIENFAIPMEDFEPGPFASFNDFFIRRFRSGIRPYPQDPNTMGAFAEARYLAFPDTAKAVELPVKGLGLDPMLLLGNTPGRSASSVALACSRASAPWTTTVFISPIPAC